MAFSLGRAEGELALKYTGGPAADKAEADVERVTTTGKKGSAGLEHMGRTATVAGAAIAGGLALAVNAAANFEQRMSGIQAVSGATADQMELIRAKALQLGRDTKFSASEAAQAMEELSKAGLTIPDIMNGAADATVALAAAGEIDLPQAATIAANAMNQFGLSAQQLPKVADLIAGAANASAIDVNEFSQAMQQAGAAAHLAGVSFPDLATSIAIMGNAGIKGSDAGTSLKTMLLNLNPATKKQAELMKKLGIITKDGANQFFNAQGKAKSMADIAQVLQNSLKGMTQQQKLATLETLFGSDAIRAAAVVSNAGAKGFNNMAGAMNKVKAADVAATRMNNLKGSIEQMKGSLETAAIQLGSIMIPSLRKTVDHVTALINAFSNLSPGTQALIINILKGVAAFLLFMGITIKVTRFVKDFVSAIQLISKLGLVAPILQAIAAGAKAMWAALLGPVGLVIAAIALIVGGIILLYQHNARFRAIVQATWQWIQANIPPIARAIWAAIVAAWTAIVGATSTAFNAVRGFIVAAWAVIVAVFNTGKALVLTAWNAIWLVLGPIVQVAFAIIVGYIRVWIAVISAVIRAGMAVIRVAFNVFQTVAPLVLGVLNIIRLAFVLVFKVIEVIVLAAMVVIYQAVRAGMFIIRNVIIPILQAIAAVFRAVWSAIAAATRAAFAVIRAAVSAGMSAVRGAISSAINAVRAIWSAFWGSTIGGIVRSGISRVINGVRVIMQIVGIAASAIGGFVSQIASGMGRAVSAIASGVGRAIGAISGLAGSFFNAGARIIQSLIDGITSRIQGAIDAVSRIAGKLRSFLPGSPVKEGPLKVLNRGRAGKQIVQMVIDGISARQSALDAAARTMALPLAGVASASSPLLAAPPSGDTRSGGFAAASATTGGATADAIAAAVKAGLTGAEFKVDRDGVGRIVADSLIPGFAMGGV